MTEMTGTPITRSGGYLIRVGWRSIGYSVDRDTENRYRRTRAILFILAIVVGVAVAMGGEYIFFTFVSPLASEYLPWITKTPELWRLMIYSLTLVVGGLVYVQIIGAVGKSMVKGRDPFDNGYDLKEQRRRASFKKKRVLIPLVLVLGVVGFAPLSLAFSVQLLLCAVLGYFLAEGLYFKFSGKAK